MGDRPAVIPVHLGNACAFTITMTRSRPLARSMYVRPSSSLRITSGVVQFLSFHTYVEMSMAAGLTGCDKAYNYQLCGAAG